MRGAGTLGYVSCDKARWTFRIPDRQAPHSRARRYCAARDGAFKPTGKGRAIRKRKPESRYVRAMLLSGPAINAPDDNATLGIGEARECAAQVAPIVHMEALTSAGICGTLEVKKKLLRFSGMYKFVNCRGAAFLQAIENVFGSRHEFLESSLRRHCSLCRSCRQGRSLRYLGRTARAHPHWRAALPPGPAR
jgi:hypothetical protein